ncbi:MAG: hypothetical protein GY737_04420 [Desulfobacteraceae bacterium]|nr:hypothetical protein [Desulfobacteraceae bacterium]
MRRIMHACLERAIVFIVFALVFLTACQDQPQQAVEPEPSVVTIPIAAKQEAAEPPKQEAPAAVKQEAAVPPKQEAPVAAKQEAAEPPKQEAVAAVKQEAAEPLKQEAPAAAKQEAVKPAKEEAVPPEKPVVAEPAPPRFYSAKGKIDPFQPLIRTDEKPEAGADAREKKPRRMLTPLEKLDLSQIRLVAVVRAESGNIAMVEEASGKGYVIRVGTYIGKNEGRVEKILNDRILIKEIVKNFRGDAVPRSREMKLHKQEIEG